MNDKLKKMLALLILIVAVALFSVVMGSVSYAAEVRQELWVLFYKHQEVGSEEITMIIDANLPTLNRCQDLGRLAVLQQQHPQPSYHCIDFNTLTKGNTNGY